MEPVETGFVCHLYPWCLLTEAILVAPSPQKTHHANTLCGGAYDFELTETKEI